MLVFAKSLPTNSVMKHGKGGVPSKSASSLGTRLNSHGRIKDALKHVLQYLQTILMDIDCTHM